MENRSQGGAANCTTAPLFYTLFDGPSLQDALQNQPLQLLTTTAASYVNLGISRTVFDDTHTGGNLTSQYDVTSSQVSVPPAPGDGCYSQFVLSYRTLNQQEYTSEYVADIYTITTSAGAYFVGTVMNHSLVGKAQSNWPRQLWRCSSMSFSQQIRPKSRRFSNHWAFTGSLSSNFASHHCPTPSIPIRHATQRPCPRIAPIPRREGTYLSILVSGQLPTYLR